MIEIEAKFTDIDVEGIKAKLLDIGAELVYPERLLRRCVYNLPNGIEKSGEWARVRDEGDGHITMSYKYFTEMEIDGIEEIELIVDDFEKARQFLKRVGLTEKAYQETKRERYRIETQQETNAKTDVVTFDIDTWPGLSPFLEIEADSSHLVRKYAHKLDLDWEKAHFGSADLVYEIKYPNIDRHWINNHCPTLTFTDLPKELSKKPN